MILEDAGFYMETAAAGMDALSKAGVTPFKLVITDLKLPDISGVELSKMLKEKIPGCQRRASERDEQHGEVGLGHRPRSRTDEANRPAGAAPRLEQLQDSHVSLRGESLEPSLKHLPWERSKCLVCEFPVLEVE